MSTWIQCCSNIIGHRRKKVCGINSVLVDYPKHRNMLWAQATNYQQLKSGHQKTTKGSFPTLLREASDYFKHVHLP